MKYLVYILFCFVLLQAMLFGARIKDIATLVIPGEGPITNQVIGYGLVSGLNNTGDNTQTSFTTQQIVSMLQRFGVSVPESNPRVRNVAAVLVTADIPKYMKRGSKINVTVSAYGNARSLQGGVLSLCPLMNQNGDVVGMAQGPLTVGGYDYERYGARVRKNEITTGRVPNGLTLEIDVNANVQFGNEFQINLNEPDYTTANNISAAIGGIGGKSTILDAATVMVEVPNETSIQQYMAQVEALDVVSDNSAKVVINERTGTIVVGGNVQIEPIVIAHGGLEIVIDKYYSNHRPYNHSYGYYGAGYGWGNPAEYPFVGGMRMPKPAWNYLEAVVKNDIKEIENYKASHTLSYKSGNVQDLVSGLKELFVKPRDLISIFQALKASGALKAELIIQ